MSGGAAGRPEGRGAAPRRRIPTLARWILPLVLLLFLVIPFFTGSRSSAARIPYSTFVQYLESGRVAEVVVGTSFVQGRLKETDPEGRSAFITTRVDPTLEQQLRAKGVVYSGAEEQRWFAVLLSWLLPILVFAGIWLLFARGVARQQAGGVLAIGKSRAKTFALEDTKVTFDDVAGVDEAKAELREIVEFLKAPQSFGRLGARMPKGVLLVGPPGTGKTLLARAVAGEAGVPFFSINGSEFVELFVGVGAARVRDLFEQARRSAPCIIFVDELDALGRMRGVSAVSGANEEKEQTLNQLLAELDGFDPQRGVVLLAATNRPEILDPALLRAGRFDRQILVDRPDRAGRLHILRVHAKKVRLAAAVDLDHVAGLTPGFTGADLANLVNEAALTATRRGGDGVTLDDFSTAIERLVAGLAKKSRILSPHERLITSYHEIGHALVSIGTPGTDPVQKVSIIPHGLGALGFTLQRPIEDRYIASRADLEARMTVLLGGRAAELVAFDELSTGAADDLLKATELAREMVMRYGMDETVGHVVYGESRPSMLAEHYPIAPESRLYSEQTAREIESAVRLLVQQALDRAVALLALNHGALDDAAHLLFERETLTRDQLPSVASLAPAEPTRPPHAPALVGSS